MTSTETRTVAAPCPTCKADAPPRSGNPFAPFCSSTCKLADLGRWLNGGFRIPGEPSLDGEDEGGRGS